MQFVSGLLMVLSLVTWHQDSVLSASRIDHAIAEAQESETRHARSSQQFGELLQVSAVFEAATVGVVIFGLLQNDPTTVLVSGVLTLVSGTVSAVSLTMALAKQVEVNAESSEVMTKVIEVDRLTHRVGDL